MKKILSIAILSVLGFALFACAEKKDSNAKAAKEQTKAKKANSFKKVHVDRNTIVEKTRNEKIAKHWKKSTIQPDDIYEAFAQVLDAIQSPHRDQALFFRILKGNKALVHYFFIIFSGEKPIREVKKGWDSNRIGHSDHVGSGTWTVTAGKDEASFNAIDEDKSEDKDNRILYVYDHYQPRGSNISVHGTLEALYRSEGRNTEGKPVAAIGFSANKDGTDNVDTLEISGLYDAILKFIYKPTGIQDAVTVQDFDAKMLGADGMFTGGDKSRIEFHFEGEKLILNNDELNQLLHAHKNIPEE